MNVVLEKQDLAVLTSLPNSTAKGLGDFGRVVLLSCICFPSAPFAYQGLYCISQDLLLVHVCVYRVLHKLHLLRCYQLTTVT